ncbi:hypothetical protein BGZ94_004187 [Podila epigama]|nr:hypothetical protein BGZ94_004187 [Podila epigama]
MSSLLKKRKHELKEIAISLGLAADGFREDLVARIRRHVLKHGTTDPLLRELLQDDASDVGSVSGSRRSSISETVTTTTTRRSGRRSTEGNRLASLSSAAEDDHSDGASNVRVTRSSPRKKAASHSRDTSDSDSAEDPLSERHVKKFVQTVHDDLEGAKELAHSLEHKLQETYRSGKESLRRASVDLTSTVTDAIDGVVDAVNGHGHSHHHHRHGHGWCDTISHKLQRCFGCSSGSCRLSECALDGLQRIHNIGSTSTGFVWITFVVELGVFLYSSISEHGHKGHHDGWFSCLFNTLTLFANWNLFLIPFFAYYGTLFVIPTILSQLFNVDRASSRHARHEATHGGSVQNGLLARKTTSALSYFVFKFALTYLLSQAATHGTGGLANLAKEAAEAIVGHHGHHHLWQDCVHLSKIFQYVPASLSAATSGVGTILALAESAVSRRH